MYSYIESEPGLWTVGELSADGSWDPESDHDSREAAADRVANLNGSPRTTTVDDLRRQVHDLQEQVKRLLSVVNTHTAEITDLQEDLKEHVNDIDRPHSL